jgi:hypothetical protein
LHPGRLLGWGEVIGTLEAGKRADLIVVHGHTGDPYDKLLSATEADLDLVIIDGVPRSGTTHLMRELGVSRERGPCRRSLPDPQPHAGTRRAERCRLERCPSGGSSHRGVGQPAERLIPGPGRVRAHPPLGQALLAVDGVIDNDMTPHRMAETMFHPAADLDRPVYGAIAELLNNAVWASHRPP